MILVTLGTQDKPFTRLIQAVEKQIELGNIQDEVIVQSGCTQYKSDKMKIIDYLTIEEFQKLMKSADILITHGGVASIIEGLKNNKKVIAVARKQEYGEHVNNHQEQIIENFESQGYILGLKKLDELNKVLEEAKQFETKQYESNNQIFINKIKDEIELLINEE